MTIIITRGNMYILKEYDNALAKIYHHGEDISNDRTGIGTKMRLGISTQYDISKHVPVLTKRQVNYKSIIKEVLWYISGSHNINDLEESGAKIWTPWKSKEFTDKHNLPEGSGGYIYGYNLIHYGADIHNPDDVGFNQLDYVMNTLRENPMSRQAAFSFWRPDTNDRAILPACHAFYSFNISKNPVNDKLENLNLHVFQRSCDYPIGVGMGNLFTGALFVYMIAQQLNLKPHMLYHTGSNCHIYKNALSQVDDYINREETPNSPKLLLNKKHSIYDYKASDFELVDYDPLPPIKFPIAV